MLQERRVIKDKLILIDKVKLYVSKFIAKGMCAETKITIEKINNLKNEQETRIYHPRVLKNLKCAKKREEK